MEQRSGQKGPPTPRACPRKPSIEILLKSPIPLITLRPNNLSLNTTRRLYVQASKDGITSSTQPAGCGFLFVLRPGDAEPICREDYTGLVYPTVRPFDSRILAPSLDGLS